MCGIYAVSNQQNAAQTLIDGLRRLQYRGYDSAGIAVWDGSKIRVSKCLGDVSGLDPTLPGFCGIGHTRWATTGAVTLENAHPHLDCTGKIAVVHNGNIKNAARLRTDLEAQGHTFKSDTDSEVIAHLLEEHPAIDAINMLQGDYALAWIKNGKIGTASRGMALSRDGNCWSSCQQEPAEIGGFQHWMRKEIQDQVEGITAVRVDRCSTVTAGVTVEKHGFTLPADATFIGCGSSYHAALVAQLLRLGRAEHASESFPVTGTTVALSQSGETADVLTACRRAKLWGSKIIGVTNCKDSTLAREADHVILLNQGPEISVAATKTFTAMVQVIKMMAGATVTPAVTDAYIAAALDREDEIHILASELREVQSILILGSDIHYPIAREAALKLKEVAYIHAEGILASELKHGPLALITPGYSVIALHNVPTSTISEIEARGGRIIRLGHPDIIIETIQIQLLAYHLAVLRNINPDRPRNLAKSCTTN